jgi:hypothetical protein
MQALFSGRVFQEKGVAAKKQKTLTDKHRLAKRPSEIKIKIQIRNKSRRNL